ncbi:MAG: DnaJ domain-containing protein, partial [Patescibacteria group bacterium]
MSKDYYKILGIPKNSSKEEIKKAYRKLAHQYHPDKKSGDETKFKEINEAYYVLADERRRAEYDRFGRVGGGDGGFRGSDFGFEDIWRDFGRRGGGFSDSEGESDFADILEGLFGFGFSSGRVRSQRGRDISIDLVIPFSDAVFGTVRRVLITKNSSCRSWRGSGA